MFTIIHSFLFFVSASSLPFKADFNKHQVEVYRSLRLTLPKIVIPDTPTFVLEPPEQPKPNQKPPSLGNVDDLNANLGGATGGGINNQGAQSIKQTGFDSKSYYGQSNTNGFAQYAAGQYNSLSGMSNGMTGTGNMKPMNGMTGLTGMNGFNGMTGMNGMSGNNGLTGMNRFNGTNSMSGTNGISGMNGMTGMNGFNGMTGMNGMSGGNTIGGQVSAANTGSSSSKQLGGAGMGMSYTGNGNSMGTSGTGSFGFNGLAAQNATDPGKYLSFSIGRR